MGKEEVKLFVLRWHDLYTENLNLQKKKKNENNQTVNKINEFKVVEYKISIQYSVLVLYTSNEWYEVKLRNSCFYNRIKRILKCLRINLTKAVQFLYTKTAKHCWNELHLNK